MPNLQTYETQAHPTIGDQIISEIVQNIIKTAIEQQSQESRPKLNSLQYDGKQKQSDVQSVSTVAGTSQLHKSDKQIEQIEANPVQIKVLPRTNKNNVSQVCWNLDKNGYIVSSSSDISKMKYYFIKIATKNDMFVMRDLQDLVTVKSQNMGSFKCLFMMCLPLISDRSVYQLQRYKNEKGSKIKLSLISGNEQNFDDFRKTFYYELWRKHILNLPAFQALNLLCFTHKNQIAESIINYQQAYNKFEIKNLGTEVQIEEWQMQLMRSFKKCENNIKSSIFANKNESPMARSRQSQAMIQRIILNEVPVIQFYLKMEMEPNRLLLKKKRKILNKYLLKSVFEFLEIDRVLLGQKYLHCSKAIESIIHQNLPFSEAVYYLDELNISISPYENIVKITNFGIKLIQCYEFLAKKPNPVLDMDNLLPLTIYCSLISRNSQLKPIISFLKDYFESEDQYQNENRTLAALKAALEYIRQEWSVDQQTHH